MTDERYDGFAHDMTRGDEPRAQEQVREHPEFDFGQVPAAHDIGQDAIAGVVFPQPLDMVREIPVELAQDCRAGPKVTPGCCSATDQSRCGFGDFLEIGRLLGWHSHHFGDDRYWNSRRV